MAAQAASFLDRWPARVIALLFAVGIGALLYKISPDLSWRLEPMPQGVVKSYVPTANTPAFEACLASEKATIDQMRDEGLVDDGKAKLFLSRAEARCRATTAQ